MILKTSDVFTWERTFTKEDVFEFGRGTRGTII